MQRIVKNIYAATDYTGVNVGAVVTTNGVIAVDAPSYPHDARDWAMRLHNVSAYPTRGLILTDGHGDRLLNTRWLNAPLITHSDTAVKINTYDKKYPHSLIESLSLRNPERGRDLHNSPVERPSLSLNHDLTLHRGSSQLQLIAAAGPNAGTLWVYEPESQTLFTGDTIVINRHPLLGDGSLLGWIKSLRQLQQWPQPITTLVPGHGPLTTLDAIDPVLNYLESMVASVQRLLEDGRSREATAELMPDFLIRFPTERLPIDWLRRQIKLSLALSYDELKSKVANSTTGDANNENVADSDIAADFGG